MSNLKSGIEYRAEILDTFWRFASERNEILYRRIAGSSEPFTNDAILRDYKFCNSFRAADRVTQFLIREVCYNSPPASDDDLAFQILLFRLFSRIETWCAIVSDLGEPPRLAHLRDGSLEKSISNRRKTGKKLYTGAFILCANDAYAKGAKHLNHLELLNQIFSSGDFSRELRNAASLKAVFSSLKKYPLIGDFMAYQLAIDLNYSDLINFSENDYVKAGPGARRGIDKVCSSRGSASYEDIIVQFRESQIQSFSDRGLVFRGLFGRPLHSIDIQNLFCEVDKYSRVAHPHLTSTRSRIKTKFSRNPKPIPFFFPPKWGLDTGKVTL